MEKPLHISCSHGNAVATKILLNRGADKNSYDDKLRTPMWHACNHGRLNCLDILLECNADRRKVCRSGHRPLQRASRRGQSKVVQRLLEIPDIEVDPVDLRCLAQSSNDAETIKVVTQLCNDPEIESVIPEIWYERNRSNNTIAARQRFKETGVCIYK